MSIKRYAQFGMNLSVRQHNMFRNLNINTLEEFIEKSPRQVLGAQNFGKAEYIRLVLEAKRQGIDLGAKHEEALEGLLQEKRRKKIGKLEFFIDIRMECSTKEVLKIKREVEHELEATLLKLKTKHQEEKVEPLLINTI